MVCISCGQKEVSRNFISESIIGTKVGQDNFFSGIIAWWNSLDTTYKYIIIGGSISIVALIFAVIFIPPKKKAELGVAQPTSASTKELEELLKLKLIKELAK